MLLTWKILMGLKFFRRPSKTFYFTSLMLSTLKFRAQEFVCCFAVIRMKFREAFLPQLRVFTLKLVRVVLLVSSYHIICTKTAVNRGIPWKTAFCSYFLTYKQWCKREQCEPEPRPIVTVLKKEERQCCKICVEDLYCYYPLDISQLDMKANI